MGRASWIDDPREDGSTGKSCSSLASAIPWPDYTGPGRTPEEGRWIELRQRLEAMAR